jgi:F0F1-type ATP synthase membrane subunit b/b'
MMRLLALVVLFYSVVATAGGKPSEGINWFTVGDPHNLAMGWFILNFVIFAGGLAFVIRGPVMRQVRERAERFETLLRAADVAREAAEKRQVELQARLDGLSLEIDALQKTTDEKLEREKALILTKAEAEIERLQKNAEISLERQRRSAERRLMAEAARLAFSAAQQRVTAAVSQSDHDRLNAEFVTKVEGEA